MKKHIGTGKKDGEMYNVFRDMDKELLIEMISEYLTK